MKRSIIFAAACSVAMMAGAAAAQDSLSGEYVGTYRCAQGMTDLRLSLSEDGQRGRFAFSARGIGGSYLVMVQPTAGGEYLLVPQRWESRPPGYQMVPARVRIEGDRLVGQIEASSCGAVTARRVGGSAARPAVDSPRPLVERDRYAGPAPSPQRPIRPSPPPAGAAAAIDPGIFLPGKEQQLEAYLVEREAGARTMRESCFYRLQTRYPRTSQVLPEAEQIRRSRESDEMSAECRRQAEGARASVVAEFRAAVAGWAAQQPATYDGLRTLRSAEVEYRSIGRYSRPDSDAFAMNKRIAPMIADVFARRRAEIEPLVRPALQAEVLRSNSVKPVTDVFYDDPNVIASYRAVLDKHQAATAQAAAVRALPPGPDGELALAAAAAFGRAPRIAMGVSMGATTITGASIDVNLVVVGEHYEFKARNAQCSAPAAGKTTCSYELDFGGGSSLLGARIPMVHSGWVRRRDVFYREAGKLRSAKLDQDMARLAEASQSSGSSGTSALDDANKRRQDDCRQQMFSSFMSGDHGTAAATGIIGCQ